MSDTWSYKIEGPHRSLFRYDIHLLQEVGDTGLKLRLTSDIGGPYALTYKGAERKARRIITREKRHEAIEANAKEIKA